MAPVGLGELLPPLLPKETLTENDRCDVKDCGARARVSADFFHTGSTLLFCGHHYAQMAAGLKLTPVFIRDERPHLEAAEQRRTKGY